MVFTYPKFHDGKNHEDVENFSKQMEIVCIINHVLDSLQILHLIQMCLKDDAQAWFKAYEEKLQRVEPPLPLNLDSLRQALKEKFV